MCNIIYEKIVRDNTLLVLHKGPVVQLDRISDFGSDS